MTGPRIKIPAPSGESEAAATAASSPSPAVLPYEPVLASPSLDMWALGVTLFQLCADQPLWLMDSEGNVGPDGLRAIAAWNPLAAAARLRHISDRLARNLVAQLLHPEPLKRPTAARLLAHPFLTGAKAVTRLPGQEPHFDVFISYRVASDRQHAARLYELLTRAGLRVWWDGACLPPGLDWEVGFCEGLAASRTAALLLSPGGLAAFQKLAVGSACDNVLLEHRLALELAQLGLLERVVPIMLSDVAPAAPEASRSDADVCFAGRYLPSPAAFPSTPVASVDAKLAEHMARMCVGTPAVPSQGPADTLRALFKLQGFLLAEGGRDAANPAGEPVDAALQRAAAFIQRAVQQAKAASSLLARSGPSTGGNGTGATAPGAGGDAPLAGGAPLAGAGGAASAAPGTAEAVLQSVSLALRRLQFAGSAAAPVGPAPAEASGASAAASSADPEGSAAPDALLALLGLGPIAAAQLPRAAHLQGLLAAVQVMTALARSSVSAAAAPGGAPAGGAGASQPTSASAAAAGALRSHVGLDAESSHAIGEAADFQPAWQAGVRGALSALGAVSDMLAAGAAARHP